MKKLTLLIAALISTGVFAAQPDNVGAGKPEDAGKPEGAGSARVDRIGGSPKADFASNELTIPCVLVEGLDDSTDGMFFDIKLLRRGKSFNYELVAAAAEDTAMCQAIADFAEMEDEDLVDEDDDDTTDDDTTP